MQRLIRPVLKNSEITNASHTNHLSQSLNHLAHETPLGNAGSKSGIDKGRPPEKANNKFKETVGDQWQSERVGPLSSSQKQEPAPLHPTLRAQPWI